MVDTIDPPDGDDRPRSRPPLRRQMKARGGRLRYRPTTPQDGTRPGIEWVAFFVAVIAIRRIDCVDHLCPPFKLCCCVGRQDVMSVQAMEVRVSDQVSRENQRGSVVDRTSRRSVSEQ